MLIELAVSQLGVIEQAQLELAPGLNVITGETGAGKTMLLNALRLLLGGRAEPALVRPGAEQALAQAVFELPEGHPALDKASQAGAMHSDGQLVALRSISSKGRTRAHLGGTAVPAGTLAQVLGDLVAVHGQSDQLRLRGPAQQRDMLDQAGGLGGQVAAYQVAYDRWRELTGQLAQASQALRANQGEAEALAGALAQIERVDPKAGEEDELPARIERLANAEELHQGLGVVHFALVGGEASQLSAAVALEAARRQLEALSRYHQALAPLAERAGELAYLTSDLAADVAGMRLDIDLDPAALEAAQTRRSQITTLLRQHGSTVAEVLNWANGARQRLDQLEASPARIEALERDLAQAKAGLDQAGEAMSQARKAAAAQLTKAVTGELSDLGMGTARFEVKLKALETPGPNGCESVEFVFSPHPQIPPRPLAKGASGGELSRLMLALELVLAQSGVEAQTTLVFDEVDQGVAGRAAAQVGARLARLGQRRQVVVVTHLAQVAAQGQVHLVVVKDEARAGIGQVEGDARTTEIARMLAGRQDSASALAHAKELLGLPSQRSRPPEASPEALF
ncbi:MAG: DNA repair protein RecN [Micrococcales bacterium]|nr:DNA repair protein RecN [Micrococcales bacterium]